jgi:hypothetical protein
MPVRHLLISTATGVFPSTADEPGGYLDFGNMYRFASYADNRTAADRDIAAVVQGTIGGSPKWTTVLTLTTNSSGLRFHSTGSDLPAFDKLRINVSANNSTESFPAWLGAGD